MSEEAAVSAANETPDNNQWNYIAEDHQFEITVDGKQVKVSTLEAVMFVLQQRYVAMSDVTAEKTREMQQQVNLIKEANRWLNAVTDARVDGEFERPEPIGGDRDETTPVRPFFNVGPGWGDGFSVAGGAPQTDTEALIAWMNAHGLDTAGYGDPPSIEDFGHAQAQISNYVDQLSSNNDLRMLSLKTAVNKAQQAMTAADGVLQNIKQLMQTITSNMAR